MKNSSKNMSTVVFGRKVAAALLISGAYGILAVPAHAQQVAPGGPTPLADKTSAQPQPESLATPKVQVFHTSPELRQATRDALVAASPEAQKSAAHASLPPLTRATGAGLQPASTASHQEGPAPWLLDSDSRPWPLGFLELSPLNALVFTLPTEREARIMLPGQAADMADRARFTVSRYITDNIGAGSQIRGRQLETFTRWAENSTRQKASLSRDEWTAYQFNSELLTTLGAFKAKVEGQTAPALGRMASDINVAVAQLTPVMDSMGSYEQKLQWYNILVQLKEGIGLYQARAAEADQQILAAIEEFELANPPVPRPEGKPPVARSLRAPSVTAPMPTLDASAAVTPRQRTAAEAPAPAEAPTGLGGSVVLLGAGGLILVFFWRLRKRVANKGAAKKDTST